MDMRRLTGAYAMWARAAAVLFNMLVVCTMRKMRKGFCAVGCEEKDCQYASCSGDIKRDLYA
jgi:hypothetical protein